VTTFHHTKIIGDQKVDDEEGKFRHGDDVGTDRTDLQRVWEQEGTVRNPLTSLNRMEDMVLAIIVDHLSAVPMLIDWGILEDPKDPMVALLVQVKPIDIDRIMGHLFQLLIPVRHITAVR